MNYQIIADEKKLLNFIAWLPKLEENEKYYITLLARKKYSDEEIKSNSKTQLKRFTSDKERLFDKIKQLEVPFGAWKLKDGAAPQKSLALYISLNPRCMKKATELMGKKCWDLMNAKNYNLKEVGENNYTIIETRGGYHLLIEPEKATEYRQATFNDKNWYQKIQKKYPVDQSGDQLIPVVGTYQGGFVPRFKEKIK